MRYKLGEICEIVSGSTPKTSIPEYWDGDMRWITPAELNDDSYIINDSVRKITELGVKKTGLSPFPVGTVLLSSRAPIGKVAIAGCEMYCNQGFKNLICSDKINNRYLFWFLKGNTKYLNSLGRGATFKEISKQIVSSIEINVPNVKEQEDAVNVLEQVSDIIHSRKQELQMLDDLIRARFVEMFGDPVDNPKGWRMKKLQELVSDDCTISYGIVQTGDDQEEGIPVFRPVDIVDHVPTRSELKKTTEEISNKYKRTLLKGREMLITVRANIADTCIVGEEFVGCNVGRGIVPIRTNEDEMILEFLKHQIDSKHLNDNIKALAKGITLIQLNMEDLREISLIVPPKEQQKAYVEFAKQTDKSKYQAEPNSRKYYIHRLRKQYQELTDSLFLYFTKLFEVIIFQKGIC